MVVGALVQRYFPNSNSLQRQDESRRSLEFITILTSIASDFDLLVDWLFFAKTHQSSHAFSHAFLLWQLGCCIISTIFYVILISDGRLFGEVLRTRDLLFLCVLFEDLPQFIFSIVACKEIGRLAVANMLTSLSTAVVKLVEAHDSTITQSASSTLQKKKKNAPRIYSGHENLVNAIAILDNEKFVSGSSDRTIKLWNLRSGQCLRTFRGSPDTVLSLAKIDPFSFVSGCRDGTCRLWDVATGDCLRVYEGHTKEVGALYKFNSKTFLSGSRDCTLKLRYVAGGKCVRTFVGHLDWVTCVCGLDKKRVLTGSTDKTIKLWDVPAGTCTTTFKGHTGRVWSVAKLDDQAFLSGSWDCTVRLWDVKSGYCARVIEYSAGLECICALNNQFFVTGSEDASVRLWFTMTGECVNEFSGHEGAVQAVASIDGNVFLTASWDGTIRKWQATVDLEGVHSKRQSSRRLKDSMKEPLLDKPQSGSV